MKKIKVGTYKFDLTDEYSSTYDASGCQMSWNDMIIAKDLVGKELDVILQERKKK